MAFLLGARRLSQLAIDADKDWQGKNLINLGDLGWGGDVLLQRLAADILGSPDVIRSSPGGYFSGWAADPSHLKLDAYATGDSYARFILYANGNMAWGPGNAPADTWLYRADVNKLQTDDMLVCTASLAALRGTGAGSIGGDTVLGRYISGGNLYLWNDPDGKGLWLDFAGNFVKFHYVNQLIPTSDNAGSVGIDSARWALIRGVTVTSGDYRFENGWFFRETPKGIGLFKPGGELAQEWT